MVRTPDAFRLPPAVITRETNTPFFTANPIPEQPAPESIIDPLPPYNEIPPVQTLPGSVFSDGLDDNTDISDGDADNDDDDEDDDDYDDDHEEEDDTAARLAFLDNLPSPDDEALLRENAHTTRAMFARRFPEFEDYLKEHNVDRLPNGVGLLVRHFLLKTARPLEVVQVLSKKTTFESETDEMFLSSTGLRPRSRMNPLDDIWEARDVLSDYVNQPPTKPSEPYLTKWDRIAMRIRDADLHRGLVNHLQSGGYLTDTINLAYLSEEDSRKLVELAGYRKVRKDRALQKTRDRILEHLALEPRTMFETYPCFTYYCLLTSQRRPPSNDSYARLVEIVLHTKRVAVSRVVRDLCQPDILFWIHVLRITCDENPAMWAVLGYHTPALAALVSFVKHPTVPVAGQDFCVEGVTSCIHAILGVDLPSRDDDTFTSISEKIITPRWSDVFTGMVNKQTRPRQRAAPSKSLRPPVSSSRPRPPR